MTPVTPTAQAPTTLEAFLALPMWSMFGREIRVIDGVSYNVPVAREFLAFYVPEDTVVSAWVGEGYWTLAWDGKEFGRLEQY